MKHLVGFFALLVTGLATNSLAADIYGDSAGVFVTNAPSGAQSMRLAGPNGFSTDVDSFEYYSDEPLPEGSYRYELYGPVADGLGLATPDSATNIANGRNPDASPGEATTVFTSGTFHIDDNGGLVIPN